MAIDLKNYASEFFYTVVLIVMWVTLLTLDVKSWLMILGVVVTVVQYIVMLLNYIKLKEYIINSLEEEEEEEMELNV